MTDGEREVLAEANDDAYEAEMAWRRMEEQTDDEWGGNFASPEAEQDLIQGIWDEMAANDLARDWTHVGDDE